MGIGIPANLGEKLNLSSQELAASGIIHVWNYEKVVWGTRLAPELNSYILYEYGE